MSDRQRSVILDMTARVRAGGSAEAHRRNAEQGKLHCRERLALLLDDGGRDFVEDGLLARQDVPTLPADGVVTGIGRIHGRPVAVMANDSTVKAGSWGALTVEKIVRIQETAGRLRIPLVYLVDSAGARITEQLEMFPGHRHAGRIFHNQIQLSGYVPQVCLLFGPSAAGGAYIPAFSDVVFMVEGNASMYLGSPRIAEVVIGEKATLEEMGGARMHCEVSGCGDVLVADEHVALRAARDYLAYLPPSSGERPPASVPRPPAPGAPAIEAVVPESPNVPFDMRGVIDALVDEGSFFEIKERFAREVTVGLARLEGRPVGVVASQPRTKGGVLFNDSADKVARFVNLCDAFSVPLLFLADVPGFMIGTRVERGGIIRHGAKMISAVSEATVPKVSVIVRKAYGAGLYAFCGPGLEPDAALALPGAQIAVMGPEAAVNAVYFNKIRELPEGQRPEFVEARRAEYRAGVDLPRLASRLHVDAVVLPEDLRAEIVRRLSAAERKSPLRYPKRRSIVPV